MYGKILKKLYMLSIVVLFVGAAVLPTSISVNNQEKPVPVLGKVWIVDDDGNDCYPLVPDFNDIQPAVDAANDTDEIHVYAGEYNKTEIDKELKLIGGFNGTSTIHGNDDGNTVSITEINVILDNFTINNSGHIKQNIKPYNRDAGVHISAGGTHVINNNISDNNGNGIYSNVGNIIIEKNIISNNAWDGIGIYTPKLNSVVLIQYNKIQDNGLDGIYCWEAFKPKIYFNYISGNGKEATDSEDMAGVKLHRVRGTGITGDVQGNWVVNNYGDGIILKRNCLFNNIYQNNISGNSRYGMFIEDQSILNNIYENNFIDNQVGNAFTSMCISQGLIIFGWEGNYWDDLGNRTIYRIPGLWLGIIPTFLDWDLQPSKSMKTIPSPDP